MRGLSNVERVLIIDLTDLGFAYRGVSRLCESVGQLCLALADVIQHFRVNCVI
jgi:hypothetical protein